MEIRLGGQAEDVLRACGGQAEDVQRTGGGHPPHACGGQLCIKRFPVFLVVIAIALPIQKKSH